MLPNGAQLDKTVDRAQQVVGRYMLLERKLIEKKRLIDLRLTHHRLHSRSDDRSESARPGRRNLRLFQHNRSLAVIETN